MKKLLLTVIIGLCVLGISAPAMAVVIPPGALSTGAAAPIAPGQLPIMELLNISFTGLNAKGETAFSGLLTQKVYSNSTGLLFTYQFSNDAAPAGSVRDNITTLTTTDFSGFTTDVDAETSTNWNIRRTSASTVGFDFIAGGANGITPGTSSHLLWIQTNAPSYTWGSTNLIDGGVATVKTYSPATPEPSSLMLLGMGILGLFGLGKKKI
ncbi:MAG: PEP-CTERM sorting domain-containing protein [Candidatus Omnitrophica bacterium]|nr:PEP-CTERM sorting domain-containing protein [Candidatus Omnitrophota bacterium]